MNTGSDTSLTAEQLIVRLAESIGVASYVNPDDANDNAARIPDSPHDLDLCWRSLNDAISYMCLAHSWHCLKRRVVIDVNRAGTAPACVNGDSGVYAIPWDAGSVIPSDGWIVRQAGLSIPYTLKMTTLDHVRRDRISGTGSTGTPSLGAVTPATRGTDQGSNRRGWDLHVSPAPDGDYVIECALRVVPARLSSLADRHPFGARHDETVLAVAKWIAIRSRRSDAASIQLAKAEADELMSMSIRVDGDNAEPTVGFMQDPSVCSPSGNAASFSVFLNGTQVI